MSSTGTEDSICSDFVMSCSESELESTEDGESDLQELYDSFEFEDETASAQEETRLEAEQIARRPTTTLSGRAVSEALLYPGSDLSTYQSNLVLFQFAIRHSLTTKAFTELLQLLCVYLPRGAAIPRSVHSLKRYFIDSFPESQARKYYYCSCCQRPLESASARCFGTGCTGGTAAVFITVPVGTQIKRMMEGE